MPEHMSSLAVEYLKVKTGGRRVKTHNVKNKSEAVFPALQRVRTVYKTTNCASTAVQTLQKLQDITCNVGDRGAVPLILVHYQEDVHILWQIQGCCRDEVPPVAV